MSIANCKVKHEDYNIQVQLPAGKQLHVCFFVYPRAHRAASTVKRGAMPTRLNEITSSYFCRGAYNSVFAMTQ